MEILDTIGNTPLIRLGKIESGSPAGIYAKLEMFNPSGSTKIRAAFGMIDDAVQKGIISRGSTIIEPTSGNQGIALAMLGAVYGFRVKIVMPDSMSKERQQLIKAYGGEVVLTPGEEELQGAVDRARQLVEKTPGAWMPDQFSNPANPAYHEGTTAVEILQQVDSPVDAFVAGVGTGGTLTGVGRVLKERNPGVQIWAVEPSASAVLSGKSPGKHGIQGIGDGFIPENLDLSLVDSPFMVSDEEAFDMAGRLMAEEGILAGISSGAAVYAAVEIGKRLGPGKKVLTILPDTAERYISTGLL